MADKDESSVLFSLKELMSLEEDRIKCEETDRVRTQQEAERARLDAERQAREAEEARIRGEEERRRQEEQRVREEQARIEAIRHAEIEKARAEAEQRARMEEIARQQEHERQLTALKQDKGRTRLRNMLIGGSVLLVGLLGGGGWFLWSSQQKQLERDNLQAEETRKAHEATEAAEKKLASYEKDKKDLEAQLASAPTQEEKKRLEAKLTELENERSKGPATPAVGRPGTTGGDKSTTTKKPCKKGDPLCSDL